MLGTYTPLTPQYEDDARNVQEQLERTVVGTFEMGTLPSQGDHSPMSSGYCCTGSRWLGQRQIEVQYSTDTNRFERTTRID
jgi:hypothetical protein